MKNLFIFTLSAAFIFPISVAAAPTAANLFWTGNNQAPTGSLTNWSTSTTEIVNPTEFDWANTVIGHMDYDVSGKSGFMSLTNSNQVIKGIYWSGTTVPENNTWFHIYNQNGNDTLTITDGITLDCSSDNQGREVRIRRRNGAGTFSVNVGDLNVTTSGVINLGVPSDVGQFLSSVNVNGNISANNGSVIISANSTTFASGKTVTLNSSKLSFVKGKADSTGTIIEPVWNSMDMSENDFYMGGTSSVNYGLAYNNRAQGNAQMGNLFVTSSDANNNFESLLR